jgi:hypothetical protein
MARHRYAQDRDPLSTILVVTMLAKARALISWRSHRNQRVPSSTATSDLEFSNENSEITSSGTETKVATLGGAHVGIGSRLTMLSGVGGLCKLDLGSRGQDRCQTAVGLTGPVTPNFDVPPKTGVGGGLPPYPQNPNFQTPPSRGVWEWRKVGKSAEKCPFFEYPPYLIYMY